MDISGALNNKPSALRACFRLLAGHDALKQLAGNITTEHSEAVQRALGPECCVPALLKYHRKSVLAPRACSQDDPQWSLQYCEDTVSQNKPSSIQVRSSVYRAFSRLCMQIGEAPTITFGDRIKSTYTNGLPGINVCAGDIIRVQCLHYEDMSEHFPIVAQVSPGSQFPPPSTNVGTLFCRVIVPFSRLTSEHSQQFWAAIFPCAKLRADRNSETKARFTLVNSLCFLKWDKTIALAAHVPVCPGTSCVPASTTGRLVHTSNCDLSSGTPFLYFLRKTISAKAGLDENS